MSKSIFVDADSLQTFHYSQMFKIFCGNLDIFPIRLLTVNINCGFPHLSRDMKVVQKRIRGHIEF